MTEATWTYGEEDPSRNIKLPRDLFAFIIKRGGDLARWQSLCIRADRISSLRGILEFLSSHFFPNLCHFELLLSLDEEESHLEGVKQTYLAGMDPRPLLHSTPQTLHTVKLSAVPYSRMFGHTAHPQFVGLTHLELRFALYVPTFAHTYKLLAASSNELVILRLDSANQARLYPTSEPFLDLNQPPRVTFPKLEALSLSVGTPQWDLGVLQIIDAPNLAVLQIYPGIQSETARAHYLCILNLLTYDPDTPPSPPSRPYFPSLIHLSYHCAYVNEDLGRFFDVYELSSLTVPKSLWLDKVYTGLLRCRSVTRLRASFGNFANVKDFLTTIARERYGRGVPLKIVEIANGPADSEIVDELKAWVETVVVRHAKAGWEDGNPMNW